MTTSEMSESYGMDTRPRIRNPYGLKPSDSPPPSVVISFAEATTDGPLNDTILFWETVSPEFRRRQRDAERAERQPQPEGDLLQRIMAVGLDQADGQAVPRQRERRLSEFTINSWNEREEEVVEYEPMPVGDQMVVIWGRSLGRKLKRFGRGTAKYFCGINQVYVKFLTMKANAHARLFPEPEDC